MLTPKQIIAVHRAVCPCGHRASMHGARGCQWKALGQCNCWRNHASAMTPTLNALISSTVPEDRLCSQCGEQPAAMVKVGTADGWCTTCLDQAAGPTMSVEQWLAFLDAHNGVNLTGYVSKRVCKCGEEIGRLPWKDRYSIGPRGGRHPIPTPLAGDVFDEPHRLHIAERLAAL